MQAIAKTILTVAIAGCCISWLIAAINMFRTVANRKPDVPLFRSWWESPFNVPLRPSLLTERGLAARRWCFCGIVSFLFCWSVIATVGLLTGAQ